MPKRKIEIITGHVPGYGGSPYYWLYVVYNNRLLEGEIRVSTEYELGKKEAILSTKWTSMQETHFQRALAIAPLASPLCSHCGKDTLKGQTSCVEKIFCRNCTKYIEKYKAEYHEKQREISARIERDTKALILKQKEQDKLKISGAFHWKDGYHFKRLEDGSVCIMKVSGQTDDEYVMEVMRIPSDAWASIICSVSRDGVSHGRFAVAANFHGK